MNRLIMPLMPADGGYSGIYKYMVQISRTLLETMPSGWTARFPVIAQARRLFPDIPPDMLVDVPDRYADPVRNTTWHLTRLPRLIRELGGTALLLPAANRRVSPLSPVPTVAVVHDLNDVVLTGQPSTRFTRLTRSLLHRSLRRARHLVAVSTRTEAQLRDLGFEDDPIHVISNGVDLAWFQEHGEDEMDSVLRTLRLEPGYLLYVSRIEHPAKNHRNLLDAYALLRERCIDSPPLVLVGKEGNGAEVVHRRARREDVRGHVHFIGYVSDDLLPALYAGAYCLVFPSLAEGFGLPLLEAMASGCPVLCSDRPPMREVVGQAAYRFEPEYPDDIAEGLVRVVCEQEFREGLVARGHQRVLRFTWTVTAESLWRLLLGGEHQPRSIA